MTGPEWRDWPVAADTHPLDVPGFLCIPQEARREAWAQYKPEGKTGATHAVATGGPGSVCRRAGIPDGINQDLVEYLEMKEARKKQDEQTRFLAMRAKEAAEKAEIASVKEAVQKMIKHRTKRRRRSF